MDNSGNIPQRHARIVQLWAIVLRTAYQGLSPALLAMLLGWGEVMYAIGTAILVLILIEAVLTALMVYHQLRLRIANQDDVIQIHVSLLFACTTLLCIALSDAKPPQLPFSWLAIALAFGGTIMPFALPVKRLIDKWRRR